MSISTKIAVRFAGVGIVTVLLMSGVAYLVASHSIGKLVSSQMASIQSVLKDSAESYFSNVHADLSSLSDSLTVKGALADLSAARRTLKTELLGRGVKVDGALMDPIRASLKKHYEQNLLANLKKSRGVDPGPADAYMPRDDEAVVLQYMFAAKNPSPLGSKSEKTASTDFLSKYPDVDAGLLSAFAQTSYVVAHDLYHRILSDHRARFGYYDLFIVDDEGFIVYSNQKELDFQSNLKSGPERLTGLGLAYSKAIQLKRDGIGDKFIVFSEVAAFPKSLDAPALFAAAPIAGPQGETIGALIYQLPLASVTKLLAMKQGENAVGVGATSEAYLVGSDRTQRTDSRFMDTLAPTEKRRFSSPDGKKLLETSIGVMKVASRASEGAINGLSGQSIYKNYRGKDVLGAYSRVSIPGLNWGLVVEQEKQEAFAPARNLLIAVLVAGTLLVVLVVLAAVRFSTAISGPVVALSDAIRRVSQGDEDARAPVISNDEMSDTASAFNEMLEERSSAQKRIARENEKLQANIQDLLLVVADASDGRLGVRAKVSEGVLGNMADALNLMLENVGSLIASAKGASFEVATAADKIATTSQQLTDAARQQTEQMFQTKSNVQSLNDSAREVLQTCHVALQAAENARTTAERGATAVREIILGNERIREDVQATAKKVKRLGERSMEISGIVKAIAEISAQTDMLALNASIEAARAGEQGKGFTIVAEQVRSLAERTKQLTAEIDRLVRGIQSETSEAVVQMESQTQAVEAGVKKVQQAGDALKGIVEASVQSSSLVGQINSSATLQAGRTDDMNSSIGRVTQITELSVAKVIETRQTSEKLARLSADLRRQLEQFDVTPVSSQPPQG